jgi:hypothetical protein
VYNGTDETGFRVLIPSSTLKKKAVGYKEENKKKAVDVSCFFFHIFSYNTSVPMNQTSMGKH